MQYTGKHRVCTTTTHQGRPLTPAASFIGDLITAKKDGNPNRQAGNPSKEPKHKRRSATALLYYHDAGQLARLLPKGQEG